jgi:hypothetical protein
VTKTTRVRRDDTGFELLAQAVPPSASEQSGEIACFLTHVLVSSYSIVSVHEKPNDRSHLSSGCPSRNGT